MTTKNDAERQEAIERLADIKPGDTIYTICRSVARSGMSATYSVYKITNSETHGQYMSYLTYNVAKATKKTIARDPNGGNDVIRMYGYGYDRAYQIVYDLGMTLFGDGYALKHQTL